MHATSPNTYLFVFIFALGYLLFTVHKTARQKLDIYDLVMLSTVALIPVIFIIFPGFAYWFAGIAGTEIPFVVMFGMLFFILFLFVHRLTVKLHRLESDNRLLIQEISLLKQIVEQRGDKQSD